MVWSDRCRFHADRMRKGRAGKVLNPLGKCSYVFVISSTSRRLISSGPACTLMTLLAAIPIPYL